jgi:hypothetical protein
MGAPWESVSMPFGAVEGDRIVSHVGVIELPLLRGARAGRSRWARSKASPPTPTAAATIAE